MVIERGITTGNSSDPLQRIGCVLIGRNEGKRLQDAIASLPQTLRPSSFYVDSGSTDGSPEFARRAGLHVIELDLNTPFTAARARNAGAAALFEHYPNLEFIQFIDGDCSLAPGWIESAVAFLHDHPNIALVCGRRRERFPEHSVYNWLCDVEWDTPVGSTSACGGDFLIRSNVFRQVNGFTPDLIAGEEPDMCFRIRKQGYRIYRLEHDMTYHDANIRSFGQWFRRAKRGGYAYAEAVFRHRHSPDGYWRRELIRISLWGAALPVFTAISTWTMHPAFGLLLILYPLQVMRIATRSGHLSHKWIFGSFMVLAKLPEALGALAFIGTKLTRRRSQIIEYK